MRVRLALLSVLIGSMGTWSSSAQADEISSFELTGSTNVARVQHTATLLDTGDVLVVGGFGVVGAASSAEIYDVAARAWASAGSLTFPRCHRHTATKLFDGRVLVAGSGCGGAAAAASAELFDTGARAWAITGSLRNARSGHTATRLSDGRVLVTGGAAPFGPPLATSELYDPLTGAWTQTGSLNIARHNHIAALLADGRVLVAGGHTFVPCCADLASAEIYDPASGQWTRTGDMLEQFGRNSFSLTPLPGNKYLAVGGGARFSSEVFDPVTGTWGVAVSLPLTIGDAFHGAATLSGGGVLVVGGFSFGATSAESLVYDPRPSQWSSRGHMNVSRAMHTATLLRNGQVLIVGGERIASRGAPEEPLTSSELFVDRTPPYLQYRLTPPPNESGWNNSSVTVEWDAYDPESGIVAGCIDSTLDQETPGTSVTCAVTNGFALTTRVAALARIDKTSPAVSCEPTPSTLWPASHQLVRVVINARAADTLSGVASFTMTSVGSSEADNGRGDGRTENDIQEFDVGTLDVEGLLRAERDATGPGRLYLLTYGAADFAGNSATCEAIVSVPIAIRP